MTGASPNFLDQPSAATQAQRLGVQLPPGLISGRFQEEPLTSLFFLSSLPYPPFFFIVCVSLRNTRGTHTKRHKPLTAFTLRCPDVTGLRTSISRFTLIHLA